MEDIRAAYAALLHDPQLRRGLVMEHERSAGSRVQSAIPRRLMVWLARGLHWLAAHVEASASSSTDARQRREVAIEALISTRSVVTPVRPERVS